jgi:hypothetical protein
VNIGMMLELRRRASADGLESLSAEERKQLEAFEAWGNKIAQAVPQKVRQDLVAQARSPVFRAQVDAYQRREAIERVLCRVRPRSRSPRRIARRVTGSRSSRGSPRLDNGDPDAEHSDLVNAAAEAQA